MTNEIGDYVYSSRYIGRGAFSMVYKGFNIITDQIVAIKKINICKINEKYGKNHTRLLKI